MSTPTAGAGGGMSGGGGDDVGVGGGAGGERHQPGLWRSLTADPEHGPLPAVLLVLTVTTGVVDAVSILSLGRVFVANMTGNVVFVGFALVGAPGFSLSASLFALAGFLLGALGGGAAMARLESRNRAQLLRDSVGVELVAVAVALVVASSVGAPVGHGPADAMAAVLAVALGLQNAVVRRLAVPDLTTTVLTMTLTGIAADARQGGGRVIGRRILAVGAMLVGAVCGALLVRHASPAAALGLALGLLVVAEIGLLATSATPAAWQG